MLLEDQNFHLVGARVSSHSDSQINIDVIHNVTLRLNKVYMPLLLTDEVRVVCHLPFAKGYTRCSMSHFYQVYAF